MLCLDGVYAPRPDGGLRFTRVKAPEREELEHLVRQIAERVGRALLGIILCVPSKKPLNPLQLAAA
jgi:hypothetical protein